MGSRSAPIGTPLAKQIHVRFQLVALISEEGPAPALDMGGLTLPASTLRRPKGATPGGSTG